ncbi:aromatic amino acid transport family protein [Helicobacter kayseriensis]|uniref:aromatic amino acid transport family protein n=1 Tax=Helicobacter kayseriensis TaxID=2905877 RepID=UPI001E45E9A7|nr:aromatic amino acid transport family protein [Helicobacter kayseriensis]MCE3046591.1 HAAAP family serine/threonine permease [Helicobacter kayseriensis]MCE3048107.1 HAAAP family serine/threonine permease [Helicobacter kayseriensis]
MQKKLSWTTFDTRWMLSLFGTAVGAGILFLPIRAGTGGFWPIVLMALLVFPMTWLSHRGLSRFVCASTAADKDITHAAEEHFGRGTSLLITILYFFAIYPICLAYGVGITNTFDSFFVNQLGMEPFNRLVLAVVLVSAMMFVMTLSEELITKACNALVYPLCLVLLAFSVYLIPSWKFELLSEVPSAKDFLSVVWLTLPVLVFSFNHSPAISTFSVAMRREYGDLAPYKASQVLFRTSGMLLFFVMFFVVSCILCLDSQDFQAAREANIPILSYFANKLDNPIISYGAPLVAFLAILSSFFGHYFGAREGLNGIIRKAIKIGGNENPNLKAINIFTTCFMYVTMIVVAYLNPSILGFIEDLGGPIIATILFLMPVYAIYRVKAMEKWKNPALDAFVLITGLLAISSIVAKFFL